MNSINKALKGMKKQVNNFDEIEKIKKEISDKSNNLTSVQPAVDQINKTLLAMDLRILKLNHTLKLKENN